MTKTCELLNAEQAHTFYGIMQNTILTRYVFILKA